MYGYIYLTLNLVDGKMYIGQKKSAVFNTRYLGSDLLLKAAVRKHGVHSFSTMLLDTAESKKELDSKEELHIKQYRDKHGRDRMYNIANGGFGVAGLCGKDRPMYGKPNIKASIRMRGPDNPAKRPDVRKIIGDANRGDKNHMRTLASRLRFSGAGNPMYGKRREDFSWARTLLNLTENPAKLQHNRDRHRVRFVEHGKNYAVRANHLRWHVKRGIHKENCELCRRDEVPHG